METQLSLKTDGVEMVDYPAETKRNVELAAAAWKKFLELPSDIKDIFTAGQLQSGVGYERKGNGERESKDIKENFDITASSLAELAQKAEGITEAHEFITTAKELFESVEQMAMVYGQYVESTYGITGFAIEAGASAPSAFIRFIYYPPVPMGTVIGEPHVDHSGFTFHLYESTTGCERLSFDKRAWLQMPVQIGKAAVFASMQTQLFSNGRLTGLCHRIVANETTSQVGRMTVVGFIPLVNTPAYDRKTHGRLQDMTPGFNYTIDQTSFKGLFTFS